MLGITLKVDDTDQYLDMTIVPELVKNIEAAALHQFIQKSKFHYFFIFDEYGDISTTEREDRRRRQNGIRDRVIMRITLA